MEIVIRASFLWAPNGKAWLCSRICIQNIRIPGCTGSVHLTFGTHQMVSISSQSPVWCVLEKR